MANTLTDFIKINNEYVKFYATTNSALPEVLKNTGAIIVVQNNSFLDENGDHLRSIYLANNFIAEGHGFSSADVRDYYLSYAEKNEAGVRKLSEIIESLRGSISDNAANFSNYVRTQGGDITNTKIYAYIQGSESLYELDTKYLLNLLKPAQYDDIYINDVCSYIEYDYYDSYNNNKYEQTTHVSYATNINELDFNNRNIEKDIIFDVPRGAEIKKAFIEFNTINNSCDGFSADTSDNNTHIIPHSDSSLFMSYIDTSASIYRYAYNTDIAESFKDNIYFQAHTIGTTKYKKYPNLPNENYISYENVINEYTHTLGYVQCNIYDTVKYGCVPESSNKIHAKDIYGMKKFSRIYDIDNKHSYVVLNDNLSNNVVFSVPMNYEITHAVNRRQYVRNKRISYYEYNISGDVYELSYSKNNVLSYSSLSAFDNANYIMTKCKNYILKNKLKNTDEIVLSMIKNDEDNIIKINNLSSNCDVTITSYFIQDSEYNSTHWFAPSELSYIQNII